jgi:hypothetical protein
MKKMFIIYFLVGLFACISRGDSYGEFRKERGVFPETKKLMRPYKVKFKSKYDGVEDWFSICFPKNFDPKKSYPVWFKFCPFFGSRSAITAPSLAWNYCDANEVILIGCNERGVGAAWFGDNTQLTTKYKGRYKNLIPGNLPKDVLEILNEICFLFNIEYVAASGASMGGYSSFRLMTYLPSNYVGAVVASCPALFTHPYTEKGSNVILDYIKKGHFNGKFVKILHGDADPTVPWENSQRLYDAAPDKKWCELVIINGGKHRNYFCQFFEPKTHPYPNTEHWGVSEAVPDIWGQIVKWEQANPDIVNIMLKPLPGWKKSNEWYLPKEIVDAGINK